MIKIAPSILSADFAKLGEEVSAITAAGADYIHIAGVVAAIKPYSPLPFDVHLMIEPVDNFIEDFARAGADIITVHAEATKHLHRTLQIIKATGKKCGVSIVPATPASVLECVMDEVDLILVMSVNPGFGGQSFIHSQLEKLTKIRAMIEKSGREIDLEVDGGINPVTAKQAIEAGANVLVAGSAIFNGNPADYASNIKALRT